MGHFAATHGLGEAIVMAWREDRAAIEALVPAWMESRTKSEARLSAMLRARLRPASPVQTVSDYLAGWLETVEVGPGTRPRYVAHVTERIAPSFGGVPLNELTPQMVRRALIDWEGAAATRAGTLRLLRAAMRQAEADRAIDHDPTAGIPYPRIVRKRPTTLTGEQARHLIATVKGERFAPILVVSLGLGLRRGEAIGLRTHDINFVAGEVKIAKSLRYIKREYRAPSEDAYRLTATKTGDERTLPLPAFVADALRARLAERDEEQRAAKVWAPNDLVFCTPVGNSIAINTLYDWFTNDDHGARKRAGLPPMRWHDLRASTATLLIEMGVDLETVRRILGHKDIATTVGYIGQTPTALRGAADKLGEAMG
jgi:integrase